MSKGYILAQSRVQDIGEKPGKVALGSQVLKLLDSKVEVMVL